MDSTGEDKTKISPEELAAKLDADLDKFINGLEKKAYTEGWPEDRWEEEMEKHPFFMTKPPEPGGELSPLMEGIQQLKYDENENTPEELAKSYKDDGNFNFKCKKYRFAIIAYTEGLKRRCKDDDLNAQLYNNRAASNFFLQNYRSSLNDCISALKLKPNYHKATSRAAQCCFYLKLFEDCIKYCEKSVEENPNDKDIRSLLKKAIAAKKLQNRDSRKQSVEMKREDKKNLDLLQAVRGRNIKVKGRDKSTLCLSDLEPQFPEAIQNRVQIGEDGRLTWPVVFMYPEYKQVDYIQSFHEDMAFEDILCEVLAEYPEWDHEKKYTPQNVCVYFEDESSHVHHVLKSHSLGEALSHEKYILQGGTPGFIIFAMGSDAERSFLKK